MDELQMVGTLLAEPDPSRDVVNEGRHRLRATMRGPAVRRRNRARLAAGLGLTAAAAAAAVVVVSAVTAPTATPNSPPTAAQLSGRQVLLAAAATAESKPASTGTYWQIKSVVVSPDGKIRLTSGTWTRRNGESWISVEPGKISKLPRREPITLRGTDLGLDEIQRLPTDPDKLKATLRRHISHTEAAPESMFLYVLSGLLDEVPAPSKVRAAAFRALAALPHITNLGRVEGGYSLRFAMGDGGTQLVVDPKTTTVMAEGFTSFGGGKQSMGTDTRTGEWTNQLPPYQLVPLSQQKSYGISCSEEGSKVTCRLDLKRR